jgi:hypothetical protein
VLGINVTDVYTYGQSYLKGSFNAIESFHWDQDQDGWRIHSHKLGHERNLPDQDCDHIMQLAMDSAVELELTDLTGASAQVGYPDLTLPMEEMQIHVCALLKLFHDNTPPLVYIPTARASRFQH